MGEIISFAEYANQKEYARVTLYIGEDETKIKRFDTEKEAKKWLKSKNYINGMIPNTYDAPNGEGWAKVEWIN